MCSLILAAAMVVAAPASAGSSSSSIVKCSFRNPNDGPADYCVAVYGQSNLVVRVTFGAGAFITNWYITAEFFRTGRWHHAYRSSTHSGWADRGSDIIRINTGKRDCIVCSTLHYDSAQSRGRTITACAGFAA